MGSRIACRVARLCGWGCRGGDGGEAKNEQRQGRNAKDAKEKPQRMQRIVDVSFVGLRERAVALARDNPPMTMELSWMGHPARDADSLRE
jgi:hypothetical protein